MALTRHIDHVKTLHTEQYITYQGYYDVDLTCDPVVKLRLAIHKETTYTVYHQTSNHYRRTRWQFEIDLVKDGRETCLDQGFEFATEEVAIQQAEAKVREHLVNLRRDSRPKNN